MNILEKEFHNNISDFIGDNKFLIALSGGSDSMALLNVSSKFIDCKKLIAVYVNHRIRSEHEIHEEINICIDATSKLNIAFLIVDLGKDTVNKYNSKYKCGIEAAARKLRYDSLFRICKDNNINHILTAHHKSDQIETILLKILRGGSLKSYLGMKLISDIDGVLLIRPFLNVEKNDILNYDFVNDIRFYTDSANRGVRYERNFIRIVLLPRLLNNPDFKEEVLLQPNHFYDNHLDTFSTYSLYDDSFFICTESFLSCPTLLKNELIYKLWNKIFNQVECPKSLINRVISEAYNVLNEKSAKRYGIVSANLSTFTITPKVIILNRLSDDFNTMRNYFQIQYSKSGNINQDVFIHNKLLSKNVTFTSAELSEVINLKNGKKKIGKLFQELKIPSTLRKFVPVMRLNNKIVAVFGSVFGLKNRISTDICVPYSFESIFVLITCRSLPKCLY